MNMAQDWSRDEEESRNRPFGRHDTENPRTNIRDRVSLDVDFSLLLSENMGNDVKKYQMHLTFNFFSN